MMGAKTAHREMYYRDWREAERKMKATRDRTMRVSLPRVSILEKPDEDEDAERRAA